MNKKLVIIIILIYYFLISFSSLYDYTTTLSQTENGDKSVSITTNLTEEIKNNFIDFIEKNKINVAITKNDRGMITNYVSEEYLQSTNFKLENSCQQNTLYFAIYNTGRICSIEKLNSTDFEILVNIADSEKVIDFFSENSITFSKQEYIVNGSDNTVTIVILITNITFILLLSTIAIKNRKVISILKINGKSRTYISKFLSKDFILYHILFFSISITTCFLIILLKSRLVEVSRYFDKYLFVWLLVILIPVSFELFFNYINTNIDVLKVIKGKYRSLGNYTVLIVSRIFITIILLGIFGVLVNELYQLSGDYSTSFEWEKYEGYNEVFKINDKNNDEELFQFYRDNDDDILFYNVTTPDYSNSDIYDKYCGDDKKNILYCNSVFMSKTFFNGLDIEGYDGESIYLNDFNTSNLIVVSDKYVDQEGVIKTEFEKFYPEYQSFEIVFVKDYNIYSYDDKLNVFDKDYIVDGISIINLDKTLSDVEYRNFSDVYMPKNKISTNSNVYIYGDDFYDNYKNYINIKTIYVSSLSIIVCLLLILMIFLSKSFLYEIINFNIQKTVVLLTNGKSMFDVFYYIYTLLIVQYIVSSVVMYSVFKEFIASPILLITSVLFLMVVDLTLVTVALRKYIMKSIVQYLKGRNSMIKITNLSKSFGEHKIFNNFNFKASESEMIAIIGASGSGKSTLLNMIGMFESYEGEIELLGKKNVKFGSKTSRSLLENDIAFIFQNFALIDDITVKKNFELFTKDKDIILDVLKKTDTSHLIDAKVATLSGGEQQRVAISRALLKNPKIILADEPTGSLDEENTNIILDLFTKFRDEGKLVIIVTHDIDVANKCDRIVEVKRI